jgi:transcriptional regulator with XRE-family HTH domain
VPWPCRGRGVRGFKAEMDGLRERMRGLGFSYAEVAAEVSRRYPVRPRQAYRLAWGWTLDQAAERFNQRAAGEGTDPDGRASMTGPYLCEIEKWPDSDRKPSVYVLCLLDLADHESLPQYDRLVLMRRLPAETTFGERVLALMEARGLPLRELARRVQCDASHLSRVVHGRKRPSLRIAARLDDVLEAGGELVALAETAGEAPDVPAPGQDSRRQAGAGQAVITGGMSLTLPHVPARLVIEVSGPAGNPGLLAGAVGLAEGSGVAAAAPGRLACEAAKVSLSSAFTRSAMPCTPRMTLLHVVCASVSFAPLGLLNGWRIAGERLRWPRSASVGIRLSL